MATASGMFARVGRAESRAGAQRGSGTLTQLMIGICLILFTIAAGWLSLAAGVSMPSEVPERRGRGEIVSATMWRGVLPFHASSVPMDCRPASPLSAQLRSMTYAMRHSTEKNGLSKRVLSYSQPARRHSLRPAIDLRTGIQPTNITIDNVGLCQCRFGNTAEAISDETDEDCEDQNGALGTPQGASPVPAKNSDFCNRL